MVDSTKFTGRVIQVQTRFNRLIGMPCESKTGAKKAISDFGSIEDATSFLSKDGPVTCADEVNVAAQNNFFWGGLTKNKLLEALKNKNLPKGQPSSVLIIAFLLDSFLSR